MQLNLARRNAPPAPFATLVAAGVHPLLAQIYAARGITSAQQLAADHGRTLAARRGLRNVDAHGRVAGGRHRRPGKKLLIVADYDCDGATACAVGMRALREFGAVVDYLVPNRITFGYGLTPEIVTLAKKIKQPDVLITVDNGIASVDGVAAANAYGMRVLITDHHLPIARRRSARRMVHHQSQPTPAANFPSKFLAGVGVMFYVLLALRAELRKRGRVRRQNRRPTLPRFYDLVALGTVADVSVKLDANNRILVQ